MPAIACTIVETVVFRNSESGPRYLVLKRSSSENLYPDIWQIVTGSIERGESATVAALREVNEETSLKVKNFWTVPILGSFYDPRSDSVQLCPLFAAEVDARVDPKLSKEHQDFAWLPADEAVKVLVWPGHHQAVRAVHEFIVPGNEAARLSRIDHAFGERKTP